MILHPTPSSVPLTPPPSVPPSLPLFVYPSLPLSLYLSDYLSFHPLYPSLLHTESESCGSRVRPLLDEMVEMLCEEEEEKKGAVVGCVSVGNS